MKHEPPINRSQLIAAIRNLYGLQVAALQFVPIGFAAVCYVAVCEDGTRRFIKLWPTTHGDRAQMAQREPILHLLRALHERDLVNVPYPLPTRSGAWWATGAGTPFAVFPFVEGQAPPSTMPPTVRSEWARTMATLHRATPALADALPPRDTFDIPFEEELRRGLTALERMGPQARPGLRALRELVLPRRTDIMAQLARLHRLQHIVQRLRGPFVVCHTDMGGDNLLVDHNGTLVVLDWDDAMVAPPEHDLHEARGQDMVHFLDVYAAAGGAHPLHLDHFAFYLLRRHLADMTARLLRILKEHTTPDGDADALHGIEAWGFTQWSALDETLDGIAAALGGHRHM